ncbi:hypothetical protein, partial [Clostridium perfringens]
SPLLIGAGALAVVAIVATTILAGRLICTPYVDTVVRMEAMAAGDLDAPIAYTDNGDCVGRMTKAMAVFRDNAERVRAASAAQAIVVRSLGEGLDRLAANDLTHRITATYP